jgi:hypothetical protein
VAEQPDAPRAVVLGAVREVAEVRQLEQRDGDRGLRLSVDVDLQGRSVPAVGAGGRAVQLGDDAGGRGAVVLERGDLRRRGQQVPCGRRSDTNWVRKKGRWRSGSDGDAQLLEECAPFLMEWPKFFIDADHAVACADPISPHTMLARRNIAMLRRGGSIIRNAAVRSKGMRIAYSSIKRRGILNKE